MIAQRLNDTWCSNWWSILNVTTSVQKLVLCHFVCWNRPFNKKIFVDLSYKATARKIPMNLRKSIGWCVTGHLTWSICLQCGGINEKSNLGHATKDKRDTWGLTYCWQYFKACSKADEDESGVSGMTSTDSPEADWERERRKYIITRQTFTLRDRNWSHHGQK